MFTFDIEEESLEKLIEEKEKEFLVEEKEDNNVYPLFKNYPNGTSDYYLKLKSMKFSTWKKEIRILFLDKTIIGDKYFNLLKNLNCKISKQKELINYNLIITNDEDKASQLMTETPIIYINCKPTNLTSKKNAVFYFDNKKQYEKYSFYCHANEIECIYRKNSSDFLDAISKIKEMT